jgi:hypothetical protein
MAADGMPEFVCDCKGEQVIRIRKLDQARC